MAPKRPNLPPPRPHADTLVGGRCTFVWSGPANFSSFAVQLDPREFQQLLFSSQVEQLRSVSVWSGVGDFAAVAPGQQQLLLEPLFLRTLPRLSAALYPGREHPHLYTHFELPVIMHTNLGQRCHHFNFSFTPRSALLLLIFGLSIRQQQGLPDINCGSSVTTLGFRSS